MADLSTELGELANYWNDIEKRVKQAEQLRSKAVIPAINELRYAGRKFIEAWHFSVKLHPSEDDVKQCSDCITVARQYLMNADHDAIDAALAFIYHDISAATRNYGASEISKHVAGFLAVLDEIDETKVKVAESRRDRAKRAAIYGELVPHFEKMVSVHKEFDRAERHILAKKKRAKFWLNLFAFLGVVGSIASVIALILFFTG